MATDRPAWPSRPAATSPAGPAPRTTTSNARSTTRTFAHVHKPQEPARKDWPGRSLLLHGDSRPRDGGLRRERREGDGGRRRVTTPTVAGLLARRRRRLQDRQARQE